MPESFKEIDKLGSYFISRYKTDTNLYDINTNEKIDLLAYLNNKSIVEAYVLLSKNIKLKVRIICKKITLEQSNARRRKANKLAKSRCYKSSEKNQKLLEWSLFITNIPENKITAEQILIIYKARWQIELLFKLYKSHIRIDHLKSHI